MVQNRRRIISKSVDTGTTQKFIALMFTIALVSSLFLGQTAIAQKVFVQTGFEEFTVGKPPTDWEVKGKGFEVTKDTVKTDKNSLGILAGANDDTVGVPIETDNPIISVEFWVYIQSGGRSFNFKVVTSDDIGENNGGVYVNWNADTIRLYDGAAWQQMDEFETEKWLYVRFVADVSKSEFDHYVGNDRDDALNAKAKKELPFRNAAQNPVAKWVTFHIYSLTAPGYVDDLLIYEGDEPINLAVNSAGKLTTIWSHIKKSSSFQ